MRMRLIMLRTQRLKDKDGHHSYKRQGEVLFSGSQYLWRQGFLFFEYDNLRCYGVETVPALVKALVQECAANGLIVESAGIYGNVIRFLAPLVITDEFSYGNGGTT